MNTDLAGVLGKQNRARLTLLLRPPGGDPPRRAPCVLPLKKRPPFITHRPSSRLCFCLTNVSESPLVFLIGGKGPANDTQAKNRCPKNQEQTGRQGKRCRGKRGRVELRGEEWFALQENRTEKGEEPTNCSINRLPRGGGD